MHFIELSLHAWCAGISSESEVGVEVGFFTQICMQVLECRPVAFSVEERCVLEEFFEAQGVLIDSSAVVSILVTNLLKGILTLYSARNHLRDCADTEISAVFDHLTKLLLNIRTPGIHLSRYFIVEC